MVLGDRSLVEVVPEHWKRKSDTSGETSRFLCRGNAGSEVPEEIEDFAEDAKRTFAGVETVEAERIQRVPIAI